MLTKKKVDATQGPLLKSIFVFAIPLVLATLAQDFFNIVDKAVLGNMAGSTSVASIGATSAITTLIINGAVGLSTGTSVVLARFVGQKNKAKIRATIDTALLTSLLVGLVVALIGNIFSPLFLSLTNCPSSCYDGALLYIRIYISAAPITLFYNYGAAVLRTLGDTRRPLRYILTGGIVNVVLNIILCFVLSQKVAAVAIATVVAKFISAALVANRLLHLEGDARVSIKDMRFDVQAFIRILRFGIPVSISHIILPLANLQITSATNTFGVDAVAGNSAAISVNSIVTAFVAGFASATTTFMGQNIGAGNVERVKRSFWYNLGVNVLISGFLGAVMWLTGRFWLGLILGADETAAIEYGMVRMVFVSLFMFVNATNKTLTGALQAFGYPFLTSVTNVVFTLGFRVLWMQVFYPQVQTFEMVMLCFTVSWFINLVFYAGFFAVIYTRYVKKGICKKV